MANLNKVMLIGNLTRDPQLKYLPNQTPVCEFGLAINRRFKGADGNQRDETTFVDCTIFGKGGEIFNQYMSKGKPCYLEGRLKFDTWEDKQGGGKRSKLSVVVEDFQFLGGRDSGGAGGGGDEGGAPRQSYQRGPARSAQQNNNQGNQQPQAPYGEEQQFSDDDIPF